MVRVSPDVARNSMVSGTGGLSGFSASGAGFTVIVATPSARTSPARAMYLTWTTVGSVTIAGAR